jgi:hypothetical protein
MQHRPLDGRIERAQGNPKTEQKYDDVHYYHSSPGPLLVSTLLPCAPPKEWDNRCHAAN